MENLLFSTEVKVGDTVEGVVVSVTDQAILLDIKQFAEGTIYVNEYQPGLTSFNGVVNVGDTVTAVVKKVSEEVGAIYLSRLPLLKKQNDEQMDSLCEAKDIIKVKITKNVNRGLVGSYLGNEVFVPANQVDLVEVNLDDFVNKTIEVKLTEYNERRRQYIASRREILYQQVKQARANELASFKEGEIVKGIVSRVDDRLGAFVKFEHNQGLIRYRELSHVPFAHVEDVVKVGEEIEVKVLKVEGNRIDLSKKALEKTPFELYVAEHKVSEVISGTIIQKLPFGAIVEVAPHVTALLHANEVTWNPNDNKLASLKIKQVISAAIISIDAKKERIGLSMKALEDNPWARAKAQVGDTITATISSIVPGKHLVVSALGVDGIININEVPMKEKSSKLEDYYSVGDEVNAVITYLDTRAWKFELSIKRHTSRVEREQFEEYMKKEQEKETVITLGDLFKDILK